MSRKRRRHRERTVVFPWETRAPAFSWFSRRHAGAGVGVLIALVAVWVLVSLDDRRRKVHATRAAIRSVMLATEDFRADLGRCPTSIEELARPPEVAGVSGRYLADVRLDGWGRPLRLRCPGWKHPSSADVVSEGPPEGLFPAEIIE
ncbi:MAG: type II secretion system protein GspG [Polyangiales bacterium]